MSEKNPNELSISIWIIVRVFFKLGKCKFVVYGCYAEFNF